MGFPNKTPNGAPFRGEVRGTDDRGWHHVEAERDFGRTLERGFSGAPAIGSRERLLGMVAIVNPDERRGMLIPVEALMRAWPPLAEPYRGLQAFREEDARYFFGREALSERLWQSFEHHPLTLLIGTSGSGKSSLVNAGFLPRLRSQEGWRLVRITPGDRPVEELARGLVAALKVNPDTFELEDESERRQKALLADPAKLMSYAEAFRTTSGCRICLVVDQFEETFTLASSANPKQHNVLLAALANIGRQSKQPAIKAVLSMRLDFFSLLQDDAATELIKEIDGDPTITLRRLDPEELQRVIQGPLDLLDVSLEAGLLGRLIHDIANNPDALPLLEFGLSALWARLQVDGQERRLTLAAYDEFADLSRAVAKYADETVEDLNADFERVRRLFLELVQVSDTVERDVRRPRSKDHLDAIDRGLWPIAQKLADKRLLTTTSELGVDIIHEALFRRWQRLAAWVNEERNFLRWRQRIEDRLWDWESSGRDPSQLLQGPMLDEAVAWTDTHRDALKKSQIEFINESRRERTDEQIGRQCDEIWERLEFAWKYGPEPHEAQALMDLLAAPSSVRQRFLSTAAATQARARRFNRQPNVALRAALGLDRAQAEALVGWLRNELDRPNRFAWEEQRAILKMGCAIVALAPALSTPLLELVTRAIAETTNPYLLWDYGATIRALADKADNTTVCTAVSVLLDRAVSGISETIDADLLDAYEEAVEAVADKAGSVAANDVLKRVVSSDPETSSGKQLLAYGKTIRALAEKADRATVRVAASAIVEWVVSVMAESGGGSYQFMACRETLRAVVDNTGTDTANAIVKKVAFAIAETTNSHRLSAYWEVIEAWAGKADGAAVGLAIESILPVVAGTSNLYWLHTYGEAVRGVAHRADRTTASAIVEQVASAIPGTGDAYRLRAYAETIRALAGTADIAKVRVAATAAVERALSRSGETTDPDRLRAYAETITAVAEQADLAAAGMAASAIIARAVLAIGETSDPDRLWDYGEIIRAVADKTDAVSADAVIEDVSAAIAQTRHANRLQAYGRTIAALVDKANIAGHAAANSIVRSALSGIADTTETDKIWTYAGTIAALPCQIDSATAYTLVKGAIRAIAEANFPQYHHNHREMIRDLAGKLDGAAVRASTLEIVERVISNIDRHGDYARLGAFVKMIEDLAEEIHSVTAGEIAERLQLAVYQTINVDQLRAYAEIIRLLGGKISGATARAAANALIGRITPAIAEETGQMEAREATIAALADMAESATARAAASALVERVVSEISQTTDRDQLEAFGATIEALSEKVDNAAANRLVGQVVSAIAETTDPDQLGAYGTTIGALTEKIDSATAVRILERVVYALSVTIDHDQLQAYGTTIASLHALPRRAWVLAAIETLKHPLAALGDTTDILIGAIGRAFGWAKGADLSLWELVSELMRHEPWLPLSRSPQPPSTVIAEFHHLLNHGPPIADLPET
jgi:hypothetical protein